MNEYEDFEFLKKWLCKEIGDIVGNIRKNQSMSSQDLERLDKMFHLKKDMLTTKAMEDAEQYEEGNSNGASGYRGRAMNGRFVSRDQNNSQSYSDGYAHGYSEAMEQMNHGNSGHYPMVPNYGPRW